MAKISYLVRGRAYVRTQDFLRFKARLLTMPDTADRWVSVVG